MLKSYIANLQLRVCAIEKLIGSINEYNQNNIKEIREGINEMVSKVHKDVNRKFDRIKKSIEKYSDVIDTVPVADKITLVHTEIQQLNLIALQLDKIQKLVPSLNTENYRKFKEEYKNLYLLNTCSILSDSAKDKIQVKEVNNSSLLGLRNQHRKDMNQLLQLNGQMIKNLSIKLQSLQNKKLKERTS